MVDISLDSFAIDNEASRLLRDFTHRATPEAIEAMSLAFTTASKYRDEKNMLKDLVHTLKTDELLRDDPASKALVKMIAQLRKEPDFEDLSYTNRSKTSTAARVAGTFVAAYAMARAGQGVYDNIQQNSDITAQLPAATARAEQFKETAQEGRDYAKKTRSSHKTSTYTSHTANLGAISQLETLQQELRDDLKPEAHEKIDTFLRGLREETHMQDLHQKYSDNTVAMILQGLGAAVGAAAGVALAKSIKTSVDNNGEVQKLIDDEIERGVSNAFRGMDMQQKQGATR